MRIGDSTSSDPTFGRESPRSRAPIHPYKPVARADPDILIDRRAVGNISLDRSSSPEFVIPRDRMRTTIGVNVSAEVVVGERESCRRSYTQTIRAEHPVQVPVQDDVEPPMAS